MTLLEAMAAAAKATWRRTRGRERVVPLVAATIPLVMIGPLTEEFLTALTSGALGASIASGAGVRVGLAASDTALYFSAAGTAR